MSNKQKSLKKIYILNILLLIIRIDQFFSINKNSGRDIYYSIDNSLYEESNQMKEFNLSKSRYHFYEEFFSEDLDVPENKYIFSLIQSNPPQDVNFTITKKTKEGNILNFSNYTVKEYIHTSNIFYNKLKGEDNQREIIYYNNQNDQNETYKNFKDFEDESKNKFACSVNYTGVTYKEKKDLIDYEKIFKYKQVVNFLYLNFVLYENTSGIYIEKYLNGELSSKSSFDKFLIKTKKALTYNFTEVNFERLHYCFRYERYNLIGIDKEKGNLFIFHLVPKENFDKDFLALNTKDIELTIKLTNILSEKDLNKIYINLSLINSIYLQVETDELILTQKNSGNSSLHLINFNERDEIVKNEIIKEFIDPETTKKISFDIISTGFTHSICYMAIRDFGLIYYDWKYNNIGVLFKHRKISHLDNFSYDTNNLGVYFSYNSTDISSEESQEFFIELLKTRYKERQNLDVNKIFYSKKSNNFNFTEKYSILDELGNSNYFIDKQKNKMYQFKRNLPYQYFNIDFKINLPKELNNKEFKMLNLISIYNNKQKLKVTNNYKISSDFDVKGIVKLQTEKDIYSFDDFKLNEESVFVCNINTIGKFKFTSNFAIYSDKEFTIFTTEKNINVMGLPEGNILFGILIISSAIVVLILGGLLCTCKKSLRSARAPRYNYKSINN